MIFSESASGISPAVTLTIFTRNTTSLSLKKLPKTLQRILLKTRERVRLKVPPDISPEVS